MNLIGEVTTGPFGAGEVLYIGDTPLAEYFEQLDGKHVYVSYAYSDDVPVTLADFDSSDVVSLSGSVDAGIEARLVVDSESEPTEDEEAQELVQHFEIEETVMIGDRDLVHELYELEGSFVALVAQEEPIDTNDLLAQPFHPTAESPAVHSGTVDNVLSDVIFELATKAPVLYLDDDYRVVRVDEENRYYLIDSGRFIRIHEAGPGGFKGLLDRLLDKNRAYNYPPYSS